MSDRLILAVFAHEEDLLAATAEVRRNGLRIVDAFTPYAVHGLDRTMGLRPSRLTWVCFICGMAGVFGMLWFQHWTASINWPLNVGGKPWNSLPSDVPVAFEAAVLLGAFSSVFALFVVSRLFPGRQDRVMDPRATDDRFVLVIEQSNAACEVDEIEQMLSEHHVVRTEERIGDEGGMGKC